MLGHTNPKGTGVNHVANSGGCYLYDSKAIADARDPELDPRRPSAKASTDQVHGRERTAPYCFESLQVQCGGAIQPREALSEMAPHGGKMSRAWQLYTEFIGSGARREQRLQHIAQAVEMRGSGAPSTRPPAQV